MIAGFRPNYITKFRTGSHLHAVLSFASDKSRSKIVGEWKHLQNRKHAIVWQHGYFDHRLRADERGEQLSAKINYMRENPVVAGLCATAEDWPWRIGAGSSSPLLDANQSRQGRTYFGIARGAADPPLRDQREK
jgi:hypothetical protein